jgi:DNA-binding transcriptional ArsR family regulator
VTEPDETAIVMGAQSRTWRRRLGPLAWAALEHLLLAAHPDHQGWAAPVGVRDIATGIGVTKDTAARAVTALRAAGLVTLEQLDRLDGLRRSGYRLRLPDGIHLRACPTDQDSPMPYPHTDRCPDTADKCSCPNNPDGTPAGTSPVESAARRAAKSQPRGRRPYRSTAPATQPTLFDLPTRAT